MYHIVTKFIFDKSYFFHQNQKFSLKWLVLSFNYIIRKKPNIYETLYLLTCILAFGVSLWIYNNLFLVFLESILFVLIFSSCIMDIKTMSIDRYVSNAIPIVALILLYFSDNFVNNKIDYIISLGLIGIFWVTMLIIRKIYKKEVLGGADVDFFIGMVMFFSYYYFLVFIILSSVIGIITKFILNKLNYKNTLIKEFPFLPGISSAFYITRVLQNLEFNFINKFFYFI